MFVRLLLLVAIAAVAWYLYRRVVAGRRPPEAPGTPPTATGDAITRCDECGIHVPERNGVRYQTHFFCTPEHLSEYLRKHGQS